MKNKLAVICISALALLLAAIAAGVAVLYSGGKSADTPVLVQDHSPVFNAIPSDAAVVMSFSSLEKCADLLDDAGTPLPALLGNQSNPFRLYLNDIRSNRQTRDFKSMKSAVSLHFSGRFLPLMIVDAGMVSAQDTSEALRDLISFAKARSLYCMVDGSRDHRWFLCSSSETLLNSSIRHISEGQSILADRNFADMLEKTSERNAIFLNNAYARKLMNAFFSSALAGKAQFFKNAADWTALSLREYSPEECRFSGDAVYGRSPSYFMNLLASQPQGECRVQEVLPAETLSALSVICTKDDSWRAGYEKYVDASTHLVEYRNACDTLKKKLGEDPTQWIKNCREVATASWRTEDGKVMSANFYRLNKRSRKAGDVSQWNGAGIASVLFGSVFDIGDESFCVQSGDWLVSGAGEALDDWVSRNSGNAMLGARLEELKLASLFPEKNCTVAAYWSGKDSMEGAERIFKEPMLSAVASSVKNADYVPLVVSFSKGEFSILWKTVRENVGKEESGKAASRVQVDVPSGPFTVRNCLSGKDNTFYQNENLYLCLKDERGKGLWGVPFSEKICGRVENIDFFSNGKIQFLFAAGSKIYLISRLGSFVNGFPVDLHKDVLLGPAVFDFTGGKGYNIMVLHTDNTIEMYNLKGKKPERWQGITASDTITGLPELEIRESGKYWKVPTVGGTLYFGFWGGHPLKEKEMK